MDLPRRRATPHRVALHPPAGEHPRDLPDLLGRLVRRDPHAVVALDKDRAGQVLPVSRGELWARTCTLTEQLRLRGIGRGDCVGVWLPNWSDTLVWQFAVAARGGHVVGINTRYNVDDVAHVLDRARPRLLAVADDFHGLDLLGRLRAALAAGAAPAPDVMPVDGPGRIREATPAVDTVAPDPPRSDPAALVAAFTTSGSTGLPKLAAHSGAGVVAHALADAAAIGIGEGDVMLCALPLSGVFGFNAAMAALAAGGVCLFEPVFDAGAVLDDMAGHAVTHVAAGDDLVVRLADEHRDRPRVLDAWRWWGAADFQGRAHELAQWAADRFGTETTGLYGSSEVFALTALWPAAEPAPGRWLAGGRVVHPGIEVRAVDPDGRVLPPGDEGELQFRGPNVVDAYLGDDDGAARSAAFTADGWFRSGDLGSIVDDGAFGYVCRMGDALRLRGFLVDPAEIENRLAAHPDVHTAKVVGIDGPDGATLAVAFVLAEPGAEPASDGLREWCAAGLAAFKVPHDVHVVAELPTTSGTNGTKIRASVLREWAAEGLR